MPHYQNQQEWIDTSAKPSPNTTIGGYLSGFTSLVCTISGFIVYGGYVDHPGYVRGLRRLFSKNNDTCGWLLIFYIARSLLEARSHTYPK